MQISTHCDRHQMQQGLFLHVLASVAGLAALSCKILLQRHSSVMCVLGWVSVTRVFRQEDALLRIAPALGQYYLLRVVEWQCQRWPTNTTDKELRALAQILEVLLGYSGTHGTTSHLHTEGLMSWPFSRGSQRKSQVTIPFLLGIVRLSHTVKI